MILYCIFTQETAEETLSEILKHLADPKLLTRCVSTISSYCCADTHTSCSAVRDEGDANAEMLLRLQRKDLSWIRLYVCAATEAAKESIACTNHVIR